MRRGNLWQLIWNTPWLLALVILIVVLGIGFWIKEQMDEAKEGEKLRNSDRDHR